MTVIAKFFLENYKFTLVLTFFFVFFGVSGVLSLNSESFPNVNIGQVIITTQYKGATAEDIESKITKPIEDEIRSVTGIKEVKSISQPGESKILTVVDVDNYDIEKVIADLQRSVDRVPDLPVDLEAPPDFAEIKTDEFPVIEVAIVGDNNDRLRDRVAIELEEDLEDNKAISSVRLSGFREMRFNILVDQVKLKKFHVGLNEVIAAVRSQNVTIPGGTLEGEQGQKLIKIDGKLKSAEKIGNIVVRANFSGSQILLKDIATIEQGEDDARTLSRLGGKPATFLIISKKSGADIIDLAAAVKERIRRFEGKYSDQLEFSIYNDEGIRVGNRLSVLSSNALAGLVLVIFFLVIFLPGRAGIMASLSLPIAVFATIGYIQAMGFSLNTITILAMVISIGMLVDNAVVIAENFARLKSHGMPAKKAVLDSIRSLWLPITATALTTIAAFLPMLVTKGILGQFIRGIPIVVTVSLVFSLMEGFFLLPIRLVRSKEIETDESEFEVNEDSESSDWFSKRVIPRFTRFVRTLIRFRYLSALAFLGIIGFAIFMMTIGNKFILFPSDQTEIYLARLEMPQGTRIEQTDEAMGDLSRQIKEKLGDNALYVTSTVGIAEQDPNDPKGKRGENVGLVRIFVSENAKNNIRTNDVLAMLRDIKLENAHDLSFEAMINGPPVGDPVTAIFRSNNSQQLKEVVEKMREQIAGIDGVFDVKIDDIYGDQEIKVNIDRTKANRLGLNTQQVGEVVRTAFAGLPVANVNINNREADYFVRLQDKDRTNSQEILGLKIMDQRGNLIPLARIASLEPNDGAPHIKRFDYKPAKTITANINDDVITTVEANNKIAAFFAELQADYKDVSLQYGGEAERTAESFESLMQALVLSIIGIFALLVFLFRSYIKPVIILTTIPLGLVGVSIAFFIHQRPVSFLALIGLVGLGGIIVNSGIVLISFIETLKRESNDDFYDILATATGLRLRAVVVTSLTTVSGLLPTAYGIGGADEFIIPMTLAMAWGLVSGTILALLWVPCAYAITEDMSRFFAKIFSMERKKQINLSSAQGVQQ